MYQKDHVSAELASFDALPSSANVRLPTVMRLFGMSAATVWRHAGKSIPSPRKFSKRITAWNVGELRLALGINRGA
jgi:predicted DNA-binding transcriptional regulator AlpA